MALPSILNLFNKPDPKKPAKKPKAAPKTTVAQHLSNESKKYIHKITTKKVPLLKVVMELLQEKEEREEEDKKKELKDKKKIKKPKVPKPVPVQLPAPATMPVVQPAPVVAAEPVPEPKKEATTFWITDGEKNKRIPVGDAVPEGWRPGKIERVKKKPRVRKEVAPVSHDSSLAVAPTSHASTLEVLGKSESKAPESLHKVKEVKQASTVPSEPKHKSEQAESPDGSTLTVITQNLDQIKELITGAPGAGELDPETEKKGGVVSTLFLGLMGGLVALAAKFAEMIPFELITKSLKFIGEIWTKIKGSSVLKWVFKKAGIIEETEQVVTAAPAAETMAQVAQVKDAIVAEAAKVPAQVLPKAAAAGVPKAVDATRTAAAVAASRLLVTTDPNAQAPTLSTVSPPPHGKPIGGDFHPVGQGKGHADRKFKGFGKDVDSYIDEGAKRFGIDAATLRGFVKMEGGWSGNDSPTGAIGVGQFIYNTWNELAKTADGKSIGMVPITPATKGTQSDPRRDKRTNALATALLAKNNADRLRKAGIPITGENLYMAHNIGAGGFVRAMSGANLSPTEWRNLRVNGWKQGMTSQDFVEFQKGRFRDAYATANSVPDASSSGVSAALAQSTASVPTAPKTTIIRQPGQSTVVQQSTPRPASGGRVVQRVPNPITDNNIAASTGGSRWASPY